MELLQLEMFAEVADTGSITKAAEKMLRAPSNVSTRIKQLEREVGVSLLVRDKRQSALSVDGRLFLEYARKIVELTAQAKNFSLRDQPRGSFHLGALDSTAAVRMPPLLAEFHIAHPAVELELESTSSGNLNTQVLDGQLTAAFSDGKPVSSALTGMKVFDEELVIITPPGITTVAQLREAAPTAFVFGTVCSYRQRFEDWLQTEEVVPNRTVQLSSYHSMVACVAAGAGMTLIPRSLLETLAWADRVAAHPMSSETGSAETWLIWRRDCRSPNLFALIDLVEAHLQKDDVASLEVMA